MPPIPEGYPHRDRVVSYLAACKEHSSLPVRRPVRVEAVEDGGERLLVRSDHGTWAASAVVSATDTWSNPFIPDYPGAKDFRSRQVHSASTARPRFRGQRVLVVDGGNSGAQILAEMSKAADATWVTLAPPSFLPDEVDGRVLFERATTRWKAQLEGPAGGPSRRAASPTSRPAG